MKIKSVSIIFICLVASSVQAEGELGNNKGQLSVAGSGLQVGDAIWVNNLCKRITKSDQLELVEPL